MSRPARPWFRFYVEACSDRKLRRLAPEHRWLFVACLAMARQSQEPGRLLVGDDPADSLDVADVACMDDVDAGMAELVKAGVLAVDDRGWFVPRWADRQYESDTSAARTARYRSKDCDVTTPSLPPSQERHGDGHCDGPDTETETDTEREPARKRATIPNEAFVVDEKLRAWARERAPGVDLEREREAWLLWARANGRKYLDHRAAFQTWVRRAQERITPAAPDPVRPVLGRGVDAPPVWEITDAGVAIRVAPASRVISGRASDTCP